MLVKFNKYTVAETTYRWQEVNQSHAFCFNTLAMKNSYSIHYVSPAQNVWFALYVKSVYTTRFVISNYDSLYFRINNFKNTLFHVVDCFRYIILSFYTLTPPSKKVREVESEDRDGHLMSPLGYKVSRPGSVVSSRSIISRAAWQVALSC